MAVAYSYLRFSSPEQAKGDSIRRQTAARDAWLATHPDVTLDTSLKLTDSGRSGYRRSNWDTYALAQFVDAVKKGRVPAGSYLLVENLDRLSREEAGEAVELLLGIVNRGVIVVQLMPTVLEFARPVNTMSLMFAIVELSRGHSESKAKSERVGAAWADKLSRADKHIVTRRLPGWIEVVGGKLVLHAEKAAIVRRMFALCVEGYSALAVAKKFNEEGVPTMGRKTMKGRAVQWDAPTVRHILTSRAAIGEYTPYLTDGKRPAGETVPGYFPAVVGEDTFHRAQGAIKTRAAVGRGRKGKHVNLFAGLIHDASSDSPMTYCHGNGGCRIAPSGAIHGAKIKWTSFPAVPFEAAVLMKLREVTAADLEDGDGRQKLAAHEARVDQLDTAVAKWEAKMGDPDLVEVVAKNLAKLKRERDAAVAGRDAARRAAANPASEALEEAKTLADVLARDNSDEQRLKVRAALRQCITRVLCSFTSFGRGAGMIQCAMVRVEFTQATMREYVVLHRRNTPLFVESAAGRIDMTAPVNWDKLRAKYLRWVEVTAGEK